MADDIGESGAGTSGFFLRKSGPASQSNVSGLQIFSAIWAPLLLCGGTFLGTLWLVGAFDSTPAPQHRAARQLTDEEKKQQEELAAQALIFYLLYMANEEEK